MRVAKLNTGAGAVPRQGKAMQAISDIQIKRGWFSKMADEIREQARERIAIPQGFAIGFALYLIAQLVGGIWWAATLSANFNNLSTSIQTQKTEIDNKLSRIEENLKDEKDKGAVRDLTIQLLQVKIGVIEGRKNGK
jgi:hypothetical protein